MALHVAAEPTKAYKEVCLASVTQFGLALRFAEEYMKAYKEVCLAALPKFGFALRVAAESMKVCPAAVTQVWVGSSIRSGVRESRQ